MSVNMDSNQYIYTRCSKCDIHAFNGPGSNLKMSLNSGRPNVQMQTAVKVPKPFEAWLSSREGLKITDREKKITWLKTEGNSILLNTEGTFILKFADKFEVVHQEHDCFARPVKEEPPSQEKRREDLLRQWNEGVREFQGADLEDVFWVMQQSKKNKKPIDETASSPSANSSVTFRQTIPVKKEEEHKIDIRRREVDHPPTPAPAIVSQQVSVVRRVMDEQKVAPSSALTLQELSLNERVFIGTIRHRPDRDEHDFSYGGIDAIDLDVSKGYMSSDTRFNLPNGQTVFIATNKNGFSINNGPLDRREGVFEVFVTANGIEVKRK